jgi:hypothetical protein
MSAPLEAQPGEVSTRVETDKAPKRRHPTIWRTVAFAVGGAVLGFGYYKLVGCRSGTCPITSNPYISTLFGVVIGFLVGGGMDK